MKSTFVRSLSCFLLLSTLAAGVQAADKINLKQTMKSMQLHYKEALRSETAAGFNQHLQRFEADLDKAMSYGFSPERKEVSLEGLNKVKSLVAAMPPATAESLAARQAKLAEVDPLRKEYHKKAKPGIWEMLLNLFN